MPHLQEIFSTDMERQMSLAYAEYPLDVRESLGPSTLSTLSETKTRSIQRNWWMPRISNHLCHIAYEVHIHGRSSVKSGFEPGTTQSRDGNLTIKPPRIASRLEKNLKVILGHLCLHKD
ncbi:hypothetical protein AVEN_8488-1 [Araneus ventricosus]|uniref:Uncharacterized protein n=1 Tax=Araneus ventricosus TaxID=182803 RepID=A0A4Y2IFD5_ARAVE|nr:hypothetical protein AVEN_8488-1 [Araneus ventricosus]